MTVAQAALWTAVEFERRTLAVALDRAEIDWVLPETRVSWTETHTAFPEVLGVDGRLEHQELFNAEIKRRGLWRVLQGTETADSWLARRTKP